MEEAISSLHDCGIHKRADFGVLDLGLSTAQVSKLEGMGCTVKKPYWTLSLPEVLKAEHQIGLVARTALREYFPGYKVYLWFDADAWAQTPEFFDTLVEGARSKGAAVICETGAKYKMDWMYTRWWYGNMMAAYGLWKGFRVARKPVINIGIMAIADTAPHWEAWISYYVKFVSKMKKVNNQHSFNAAVTLENLPCHYADARCNWITYLSIPSWNPKIKLLCEPNSAAKPISVVHMAGPNKRKLCNLDQTIGGTIETPLDYVSIKALRG